jgi:hypothetical protein
VSLFWGKKLHSMMERIRFVLLSFHVFYTIHQSTQGVFREFKMQDVGGLQGPLGNITVFFRWDRNPVLFLQYRCFRVLILNEVTIKVLQLILFPFECLNARWYYF